MERYFEYKQLVMNFWPLFESDTSYTAMKKDRGPFSTIVQFSQSEVISKFTYLGEQD